MNWNVTTGIIILGGFLFLCILVPVSMEQKGNQKMTNNTTQAHVSLTPELPHAPEEWVIASFGRDESNQDRSIFLENPDLMDVFINASEMDTGRHNYPKDLVLGYVKDSDVSIVILLNPNERVNQTVVNEIYNQISSRGRTFNITSVPCKFIRMDVVRTGVPKDTMP
jgi:hypothetical protein